MDLAGKKILVAYFSHIGETWSNGDIVEIEKGNTEIVAEYIAKKLNADLFKIEPLKPYPAEYQECSQITKLEKENNLRPELKKDCGTDGYDIVIIGGPSWWRTYPMIIYSFLEKHQFENVTILPFLTNETSGLMDIETSLKKSCPLAQIGKGLSIHGTLVNEDFDAAKKFVDNWLNA